MSADRGPGIMSLAGIVTFVGLGGLGAPVASDGEQDIPQSIILPGEMPSLKGPALIQTSSPELSGNQEVDNREYQIALDTMQQLVKIDSNPVTQEIYRNAAQNPEEFIEIMSPLGAKEHYIPNFFTYYVYFQPTVGKNSYEFSQWSIQIRMLDSVNDTRDTFVLIQLNSSGHVYRGPGDFVAGLGGLSMTTKALQADYLFNIPSEMQSGDWHEDKDPESPYSYMRRYPDGNDGELTQRIGLGNVILLEANFPAKDSSQK